MKLSDSTKTAQVRANEYAHNNQCGPLTTSERLVLAALRVNQWGKTVTDLQYVTGLSDKFIRLSLRKLEQSHLVCGQVNDGVATYHAVDLLTGPLCLFLIRGLSYSTRFADCRNQAIPREMSFPSSQSYW
jgi:hypothetical protein